MPIEKIKSFLRLQGCNVPQTVLAEVSAASGSPKECGEVFASLLVEVRVDLVVLYSDDTCAGTHALAPVRW